MWTAPSLRLSTVSMRTSLLRERPTLLLEMVRASMLEVTEEGQEATDAGMEVKAAPVVLGEVQPPHLQDPTLLLPAPLLPTPSQRSSEGMASDLPTPTTGPLLEDTGHRGTRGGGGMPGSWSWSRRAELHTFTTDSGRQKCALVYLLSFILSLSELI